MLNRQGVDKMKQRLIVGISGASGVIYGIRLLEVLRSNPEIETHLILSPAARITIVQETDYTVRQVIELADVVHAFHDVGAAIASGSFRTMGMVIIPCSIKTLGAIVSGYTADLMSRAADVTLKEGRPLVLVVRETPLHIGHLDLMRRAARMGAVIMPPVPAFYGRPRTIQDLIDQTVGRVLLRLGIENDLYARWKEG